MSSTPTPRSATSPDPTSPTTPTPTTTPTTPKDSASEKRKHVSASLSKEKKTELSKIVQKVRKGLKEDLKKLVDFASRNSHVDASYKLVCHEIMNETKSKNPKVRLHMMYAVLHLTRETTKKRNYRMRLAQRFEKLLVPNFARVVNGHASDSSQALHEDQLEKLSRVLAKWREIRVFSNNALESFEKVVKEALEKLREVDLRHVFYQEGHRDITAVDDKELTFLNTYYSSRAQGCEASCSYKEEEGGGGGGYENGKGKGSDDAQKSSRIDVDPDRLFFQHAFSASLGLSYDFIEVLIADSKRDFPANMNYLLDIPAVSSPEHQPHSRGRGALKRKREGESRNHSSHRGEHYSPPHRRMGQQDGQYGRNSNEHHYSRGQWQGQGQGQLNYNGKKRDWQHDRRPWKKKKNNRGGHHFAQREGKFRGQGKQQHWNNKRAGNPTKQNRQPRD